MVFTFFLNAAAPTEIYTLSLHDALPISTSVDVLAFLARSHADAATRPQLRDGGTLMQAASGRDRKSTRLNSSHPSISYAVFCLKKKNSTTYYRKCLSACFMIVSPRLATA